MAEKLQPGKISGELSAAGFRFGIVVSRFNSFITERLLAAAVDALERAGAARKDVDVVNVPGAFELPLAQMDSGLPIMFCVLTCDTLEQAIDRAGLKGGNKGFEAGLAAIEMAQLSRKLRAAHSNVAPAGKPRQK